MRFRFYRGVALVALASALPILTPCAFVAAQEPRENRPAHRALSRHKRPSIDDQVEFMARYLELTDSQQSSLRSILARRQQQILAMRSAHSDFNVPPSDMFRAIEDQTAERIRGVLNEEQRKRYDPLGTRQSRSAPQQQSVEDWLKTARPQ